MSVEQSNSNDGAPAKLPASVTPSPAPPQECRQTFPAEPPEETPEETPEEKSTSQEVLIGASNQATPREYTSIWLTFVAFHGDREKTAAATGHTLEDISDMDQAYGWSGRVKRLAKIRRDQGPDAFAKELNRTVNLVQAIRCRNLLDNVLTILTDMKPADVRALLTVPMKGGGKVLSTRGLTDLVKACESIQDMTYKALGDTLSTREKEHNTAAGLGSLAVLKSLSEGVATTTGNKDVGAAICEQLEETYEEKTQERIQVAKDREIQRTKPGRSKRNPGRARSAEKVQESVVAFLEDDET